MNRSGYTAGDSHLPEGARDRTFTAAAAAAAVGDTSSRLLGVREGIAQRAPVLQEHDLARTACARGEAHVRGVQDGRGVDRKSKRSKSAQLDTDI